VLLVDDHPAVRRVLRSLLEEVGGWPVVGEADSGEAAIPWSSSWSRTWC
jgi:DNA-binding NarL/FixJ family response regulator